MASNPTELPPGNGKALSKTGEEARRPKVAIPKDIMPHRRHGGSGTARLGAILEEAGLVNEQMIRDLISSGTESAQSIKRSLIQQGLVREDDILDALAHEMHLERINMEEVKPTPELIEQIQQYISGCNLYIPGVCEDKRQVRDARMVELYFEQGVTTPVIAGMLGVTPRRVRQVLREWRERQKARSDEPENEPGD